jgi:hypothetical protein
LCLKAGLVVGMVRMQLQGARKTASGDDDGEEVWVTASGGGDGE